MQGIKYQLRTGETVALRRGFMSVSTNQGQHSAMFLACDNKTAELYRRGIILPWTVLYGTDRQKTRHFALGRQIRREEIGKT